MKRSNLARVAFSVSACAAMVLGTAATATASTPLDDPIVVNGVPFDGLVVSEYDRSVPVVIAGDGGTARAAEVSESAFETEGEVGTLGSCPKRNYSAPGTWAWYTSNPGCYLIGYPGYTVHYSWGIDFNSLGDSCIRGQGYLSNGTPFWTNLGCGTGGSGTALWGNVASYTRVSAYALDSPVGTSGQFW